MLCPIAWFFIIVDEMVSTSCEGPRGTASASHDGSYNVLDDLFEDPSEPVDDDDGGPDVSGSGPDVRGSGPDADASGPDASISGHGVSASGHDVSASGLDVSGSGFDVSGSGLDVSGGRHDVSVSGHDVSASGPDVSGSGPDARSSVSDSFGSSTSPVHDTFIGSNDTPTLTTDSNHCDSDVDFPSPTKRRRTDWPKVCFYVRLFSCNNL